jgi:hypothetical protein
MRSYASETTVPWEKSRDEIESVLKRYRCSHFAYMTSPESVMIAFMREKVPFRIEVPLPTGKEKSVRMKPNGMLRPDSQIAKAVDQEQKRRWRVLILLIKAKLEWVSLGMSTVEKEFLADVSLPNGETLGVWAAQHVHRAIGEGKMPASLLALPQKEEVTAE